MLTLFRPTASLYFPIPTLLKKKSMVKQPSYFAEKRILQVTMPSFIAVTIALLKY
jgi:hypothetical protein